MTAFDENLDDVELRLIDPSRNRFRLYGITECCTLFGELCLRIVWGRIGNRVMRERSEVFENRAALQRRRDELLGRRRGHGYASTTTPRAAARERAAERTSPSSAEAAPSAASRHVPSTDARRAMERAIVEDHGLFPSDPTARQLVARWHAATLDLMDYLAERRAEAFDLIDISTLAAMFVGATAA